MTKPKHCRPSRRGLRPVGYPGQKERSCAGEQGRYKFLRERMVRPSHHEHDAEDCPQSAVYLDLLPPPLKFSPLLHEWLKLSGTLPQTLRLVRVLGESGDQSGPC
jgi:hypothetical protein